MTRRTPPSVIAAAAAGFALMHLPVVILAVFSFNASRYGASWSGLTLQWYRALFARPDLLGALRLSLVIGALATILATSLGTLLALGMHRAPRGRALMNGLVILPIVTPEIVAGIGLLAVFASAGITLGVPTILIAHVAFCIPFVAVVVGARLRGMDASLEEAALTLGARPVRAFVRVTLPLLWPGILAGALLAFTMSIDDFVITFFVAGPGSSTLPLVIYAMARRTVDPTINAASTLLIGATTLLILAFGRLAPRQAA